MIEKTNFRRRIICLLVIISLVGSIILAYKSNAAGESYKVKQVTSVSEINSNNLYQYIIVYEDGNGNNYAWASCGSAGGNNMQGRSNVVEVSIDNGVLTPNGDTNILWEFTKSKLSVMESNDHPAISSYEEVYSGRKNIMICDGSGANSTGGLTGMIYVADGNGFTFEAADNNEFFISEDNCEAADNYLSYTTVDGRSYFAKSTKENATSFKIYKVVNNYNYHSSEFLSSEETAQMEDVEITKNVSEYETYYDTAIAEVTLTTQGTDYEKVCDVVLILDDSTSVYMAAPDSADKTRAQIIREDAALFAGKILEANPENRVSVIKFGREITNEEAVDRIGFSNNMSEIEEMIGGDKDYTSYGTDYSIAFKKANEVMEAKSDPNHGKVVIFISDGIPTWFNGINYTIYENTPDSTGVATNWINFISNSPLGEVELMAQTGTAIYTIGAIEDDTQIDSSVDGYYIPAAATRDVLTHVATQEANFYDFDKIETELESILEDIAKDFNYYPKNAVVVDQLTKDINLLTKNVQGYIPKIVYKQGDTVLETITFNEDGTEAYSSFDPETNIMNNGTFTGHYVSFDGNSMHWNIGDLYKYLYSLEFPIYLNNTVDLYGDGKDRPTGDYSVSDTTSLNYTDVTGDDVEKEFEPAELPWKNPTDASSTSEDNEPEEPKPEKPEEKIATNVSTGDNTFTYVGIGVFIASVLALYKKKLIKAKKYNNTIIY